MKSLQHATVLFYAAQFYFLTQQALLHSVSLPSCINSLGYQVGRPAMDYRPKQGCIGEGGGNNASSCLTLWKLDLSTSLDEQYGPLSLFPWTWTLYLLLSTIVQTFDDIWDFYCPLQGCTVAKPNLPQYNMGALSKRRRGGGVGGCGNVSELTTM